MNDYLGDLLDYRVNSWLRLYNSDFDRRHTERLTDDNLLPEWQTVIAEFKKFVDGNEILICQRLNALFGNFYTI